MATDGVQLGRERFFGLGRPVAREHAPDEAAGEVTPERETGGLVTLAVPLEARAVEEGAERQDIRAEVELAEELLSRKQRRGPSGRSLGGQASIARRKQAGKGDFLTGFAPE